MIESINNSRIKDLCKLKNRKFQKEEEKFLIEGEHLVEEASKCGLLLEVFILEGHDFNYENKTYVKENVMKKLSDLTSVPKIIGVARTLEERKICGNVLILDNIRDPGNLGTIIRSAVAFNVDTIILGLGTVSMFNSKVVRASEGEIFHINILNRELKEEIINLKKDGFYIYATDVTKGTSVKEVKFKGKTAVIMGNEGQGVGLDLKDMCDEYLYIPMSFKCESLNVGVATSIILYELAQEN